MTPLYLNQFTREVWGEYDAYVLAQLEPAILEGCYDPRVYKAPDISQEVLGASGPSSYVAAGVSITPGALILGFVFPADFDTVEVNVQVTDTGLNHKFWSSPIPWYMVSNGKLDMPNLLPCPYPVVDPGKFLVEFYNVSGEQFRTQLMFLCLEPKR